MATEQKLTLLTSILSITALSVYLAEPISAAASGSDCVYAGNFYSQGACIDNCFWFWQEQKCQNGTWLQCGSCS